MREHGIKSEVVRRRLGRLARILDGACTVLAWPLVFFVQYVGLTIVAGADGLEIGCFLLADWPKTFLDCLQGKESWSSLLVDPGTVSPLWATGPISETIPAEGNSMALFLSVIGYMVIAGIVMNSKRRRSPRGVWSLALWLALAWVVREAFWNDVYSLDWGYLAFVATPFLMYFPPAFRRFGDKDAKAPA